MVTKFQRISRCCRNRVDNSNIVAGIVGAFVGGWIMNQLGRGGVTGFNLPSLGVAFLGAVVVLALLNLLTRR